MIDILVKEIQKKDNPTVVGLDPRLNFVPTFIKEEAFEKFGKTPRGAAEAFLMFNKRIIDAVYDLVPAIKPQVAMYEQYGAEGINAYIETIKYAKKKGLVIIGDIKRGDIATTAEAYSDGHIGKVDIEDEQYIVYDEDSITINPYLGYDSVEPYINNCKNFNRGLFILVKTSNPNSGEIQDLIVEGEALYKRVGRLVNKWGEQLIGKSGYSQIGAVVGATHSSQAKELREIMPNNYFLVPGYGAQGATAKDLKVCFNKDGLGAIVNSSRGIIAAYKNTKYTELQFAEAAREAVIEMKKDLKSVL